MPASKLLFCKFNIVCQNLHFFALSCKKQEIVFTLKILSPFDNNHPFNFHRNRPSGLFLKSPETFRACFGCHNSLYIFATPRFQAIKLRNPLSFSYIKNMLKDQLLKISRLQFDDWLFGPEKFSGLSRNRHQIRKFFKFKF